jgi:proline dehydrogenase
MTQRAFARRAVQRFMPGERLDDALAAARSLSEHGIGSLVTRLGETLTGEGDISGVREHYLKAYAQIEANGLATQISIKPTQLGLDASVATCLRELRVLAQCAAEHRNVLWIDMEDSSYVDRTLDLFEQLRATHANIGLAMQAYLFRTPRDVERLLPLRPLIRLVKGAYAEPASVAFPAKRDTDAQYVAVGETLLAAAKEGNATPVFGTHDMNIVSHLVQHAHRTGVAQGRYEVHMLYGIQSARQRLLASQHVTVKCLISYGENWFPWYMRRLAERPANVWFVVKSTFTS